MGLGRTTAIVIGSFPLGESDRVVTFFSRQYGKIRGVAKAARRLRSRFGGALELLTMGELVFFDTGRSDLVRVDHFDVLRPFDRVRSDLERLGQGAWLAECVGRLTGERDPHAAVYGLLRRGLESLEEGVPPRRVAVVFGVRLIDALGHRLRVDACVGCGRRIAVTRGTVALDVEGGGIACETCAGTTRDIVHLGAASLAALRRLRGAAWREAVATALGGAGRELRELLDLHVTLLAGQPPRVSRFVRELERFSPVPGGRR